MTHPDELLAEYVDGTLGAEGRRSVERHLVTCERCRTEVALAGEARSALASLVEPAVPPGVAAAAIDEAARSAGSGGPTPVPRRGAPVWYRWAVGAAAAAALVVAALALPHLGGGPAQERADVGGASSEASQHASAAETIDVVHHDYDAADISALALSYGSPSTAPGVLAPPAQATAGGADRSTAFSQEITPDAESCLSGATPSTGGTLVRLIRARFEGTAAYIGVYLEGPGAGQAPDTVRIWVVARDGCAILNSTRASL